MQSKPSAWLSLSSVRAVRVGPIRSSDRFIETATPVVPGRLVPPARAPRAGTVAGILRASLRACGSSMIGSSAWVRWQCVGHLEHALGEVVEGVELGVGQPVLGLPGGAETPYGLPSWNFTWSVYPGATMMPPKWWMVVYSDSRVDSWPPCSVAAEVKPA